MKKRLDLYWLFAVYLGITKGDIMSKFTTPKAIASKKKIKKGLKDLGKFYGLDSDFFAALTFDDKSGTFKICPSCGGDSIIKDFV